MDSREEFTKLAHAKREADDYHSIIPPEMERLARFFWWIISGLFGATILITIWVTNTNINMAGLDKRVTTNTVAMNTTEARFRADDLTHLQTNQSITSIQEILKDWKIKISQVDDMWQMKIRGENNDKAFFREHGYPAPTTTESPHKP